MLFKNLEVFAGKKILKKRIVKTFDILSEMITKYQI